MPIRNDAPEMRRCNWCGADLLPVVSPSKPGRPSEFCCDLHRSLRRRALAKSRRYARMAAFWRARLHLVERPAAVEKIIERLEALAASCGRQRATEKTP
jgi:hypothetical protein